MEINKKELKDFKFGKNIQTILNSKLSELIEKLTIEKCNYYISGGFALALLIAPRIREQTIFHPNEILDISNTFYDDIDIFFETELDFYKAKSILERLGTISFENENQSTYFYKNNKIQLIKREFGPPSIIMEDFDFINCCIFFNKNLEVITHKNFYKSILTKELTLNKMRFTEIQEEEEFKKYAAIITKRIKKYTERYSWILGTELKRYIQGVINYYPNLIFSKDQRFYGTSNSYVVQSNVNVWTSIEPLGLIIPKLETECQKDT